MLEHRLNLICAALMVCNQNRSLSLTQPIVVRLSGNDYDLLEIHGLQVSPKKELFVMTLQGNGHGGPVEQWDKLEATDDRSLRMINAIHKRVFETYKIKEEELA
jgi:hypothetical protein